MKLNIIFLIALSLFLAACAAPQVTVTSTSLPTETPIPTPTLHPQFVEIQEQIAASGGRFTLQVDGTIQDDTEIIPGLAVALDGTMTLKVDGETFTLDPADMNFDDEKGISIKGYEWDAEANDGAGAWVEAMSPAEKQLHTDLDKWSLDAELFDVGYNDDGKITLTDKESGKIVYRDGAWNVLYLGEMIREEKSCKITDWTSSRIGKATPSNFGDFRVQYMGPMWRIYQLYIKIGW